MNAFRARTARRPLYTDRSGQRRHRPDYMLVIIASLLLIIGLVVVYAISPGLAAQHHTSESFYVGKQILAVVLGIVSFLIVSRISLDTWGKLYKPLAAAALLATLLALVLPVTPEYPAHRWVRFGSISMQSVEMIKLALVLGLAYFLAQRKRERSLDSMQRTFKPLLIMLGVGALIIGGLQSDLGSAGVLVATMGMMVFVAGLPLKRILIIGSLLIVGVALLTLPVAYRRERVLTFLNPERDCLGAGYQSCQALIAVGSGGLTGKGLGHGAQAYGYLPEPANDSVFAVMAEKFGFIGMSLIVCLYIVLFSRIKQILERAPDDTSRLVVTGVLAWLSTQAIINIGAMLGLLPLKGITLPFVSYGGTSVVFVTAALGLVFNISRYTTFAVSEDLESPSNDSGPLRYSVRRPGT